MSWLTNSIKRSLNLQQAESFEQCVSRLRETNVGTLVTTAQRIAQLEDDLARAALVIHSLVEVCIRQGVFTADEIARVTAEVDLLDGVADGKLDPATTRPGAVSLKTP